jgi:hypothetical protein
MKNDYKIKDILFKKNMKWIILGLVIVTLIGLVTAMGLHNKEENISSSNEAALGEHVYVNNGDGTVTDKETGLMWQLEEVYDVTLEQAKQTADSLSLGAYDDWRIPTMTELLSIVDEGLNNPPFESALGTSKSEYFWSSESKLGNDNKVWVLNAGGGVGDKSTDESHAAGGKKIYSLKCVRGSLKLPETRFTDNKDGTITDNFTGLIWQQKSCESMTLQNAKAYAKTLTLGEYSDWRLPDMKELAMLCDRNYISPAINTDYFSSIMPGKYWTRTILAGHDDKEWYVDLSKGMTSYEEPSTEFYILCVHDPK